MSKPILFLQKELHRLVVLLETDCTDQGELYPFLKRFKVYTDIKKAQKRLTNYSINISVRKNEPTY